MIVELQIGNSLAGETTIMSCTRSRGPSALAFARFLTDRRGGVAPLLALGLVPLVGMVGAAVDYSRANSVRTAMQAALDSTALMLSKDAQNLSSAQLTAKAT